MGEPSAAISNKTKNQALTRKVSLVACLSSSPVLAHASALALGAHEMTVIVNSLPHGAQDTFHGWSSMRRVTVIHEVPQRLPRLRRFLRTSACFVASAILVNSAAADVDTTAPTLTSLTFPSTINLFPGPQTVTWNVAATDTGSGLEQSIIWFDKSLTYGFGATGGSPGTWSLVGLYNGTTSAVTLLSQSNNSGLYTITHVDVSDISGNTRTYSTGQLAALGYSTSFTITGSTPDKTPPTLSSLSFPSTISLASGPATATWSVGATDTGSGIQQSVIWFDKSLTYGFGTTGGSPGTWSLVGLYNGATSAVTLLSQFNDPGLYTITHIDITDVAGNTKTYSTSDLATLGYSTSVTITGSTPDKTPPTLTSVSFPSTISVASGPATVTWSVAAIDIGSGIQQSVIWLDKPLTYGFGTTGGSPGTWSLVGLYNGTTSTVTVLAQSNNPGLYTITHVDVTDVAGNLETYSTAQLAQLGLQSSFLVVDSSSMVLSGNNAVPAIGAYDLIALSGYSVTTGGSNQDDTYAGQVFGTGGLIKVGDGTLTLSGNNYFTGGISVHAGTLSVSSDANLGSGGTLSLDDTTALSITASGTFTHAVTVTGDPTFNVSTGNTVTWSGAITGTGDVVLAGGGTLILTGVNTYSGGTAISSSTLQIGDGGTTGSVIGDVTDNGTLVFKRSDATLTYDGAISGSGSLTQAGTGTLILTANSTYTGATVISSGATLALSGSGSIGASNGVTDNGTFDITNMASGVAITSVAGVGSLNLGVQTLTLTNASGTFSGVIGGTGGIRMTGGTETLTGINTFTGTTVIDANATLALSGAGSIATSSGVTDNGTFDISATTSSATVAFLSGTGTVVLGTRTLTLNNASGTFSGSIGGTGGVTVAGGTWILSGTNAYTGRTMISSGTVKIGAGGTAGEIAGDVTNNGSLVFNRSDSVTYSGVISGSGTLTQNGGGTLTLVGANTYTGNTLVAAGNLQIGSGGSKGSIASASISDIGAVIFNRSDLIAYAGVISGTGMVTQAGSGTLVLNGANTYTGPTTVASGALQVGDSGHGTAKIAGAVDVLNGAALSGHGTIAGAVNNAGVIAPGGSVGTLSVGTYAQTSTGLMAASVSPNAASLLNVTGTASLAGKLSVTFDSGTYLAAIDPLVKARSISGTFSSFTASGAPTSLVYGVYYAPSGTEIDLVVAPKATGQIYGDVVTNSLDNARALNDVAFDHTAFERCLAPTKGSDCDGLAFWARGIGGTSHMSGGNGADAFTANNWGVVGGLDYRFSKVGSLHAAMGYSRGRLSVHSDTAKADTDTIFGSLAGHSYGPVILLDADVFYLAGSNAVVRGSGAGSTVTSSVKTTTAGFSFQVSFPLLHGDFTPLAKASYAYLSYGPAVESGGGELNLAAKHGTLASGWYDLGFRISHTFAGDAGITLQPSLMVAAEGTSGASSPQVEMRLVNVSNTDFQASSPARERLFGRVRLGLVASLGDTWSVQTGLDGRLSGNQQQVQFNVGAAIHF